MSRKGVKMTWTHYPTPASEFLHCTIETTRVGFKANRLRSVQVQEFEAQAARALDGGRLGHASTTDPEVSRTALLDRALRAARHRQPVRMAFPPTRLETAPADPTLFALSSTDLTAVGEEMMAIIRQAEPRAMVELDLRRSRERWQIHNSEGGAILTSAGQLTIEAWVERHQRDDVLVLFDTLKTARLDGEPRRMAERIAQGLIWATHSARLRAGRLPVILSPRAVAVLLQPLILALSGARVRHGSSPLAGKRGQQLFDPRLTLIDDGTLSDRPNGGGADHEGTPTQRTVLIRNGVLENFYYDLHTAALAGAVSTGNGRRELLASPRTLPTNLILSEGATSLEDMIASTDDGLLVDQLLGAGPLAALHGTFSRTIALGYRIEHGRITGCVKGAALAGNLYEMLNNLIALGNTSTWFNDLCAPYMQVAGLNVTV